MSLQSEALALAQRGLPVFPCAPRNKFRPFAAGYRKRSGGFGEFRIAMSVFRPDRYPDSGYSISTATKAKPRSMIYSANMVRCRRHVRQFRAAAVGICC
jgi:hypothetical protein